MTAAESWRGGKARQGQDPRMALLALPVEGAKRWRTRDGDMAFSVRHCGPCVRGRNRSRRCQRLEAGELDLEVGLPVAVGVAFDDRLVVGGAGVVDLKPAELPVDTGEGSPCGCPEAERLPVMVPRSMSSMRCWKSVMRSRVEPLPISLAVLKSKSSPPLPPVMVRRGRRRRVSTSLPPPPSACPCRRSPTACSPTVRLPVSTSLPFPVTRILDGDQELDLSRRRAAREIGAPGLEADDRWAVVEAVVGGVVARAAVEPVEIIAA